MRRLMRWALGTAVLGALCWPATARASDPWTIGGGLIVGIGANFIDQPDDQTFLIDGQEPDQALAEYPGFAGMTSGFGFFFELRFWEVLGIELDAIRTSDEGATALKLTDFNTDPPTITAWKVEIAHSAWHLPLLFKLILPTKVVNPSVFIGPEFVLPTEAEWAELEGNRPESQPERTAFAEDYTMVTFGLGFEIELPTAPVHISIPISLRASVNPGVTQSRSDRTEVSHTGTRIDQIRYRTEWQYQALGTIGVGAHF